MEKKKIEKFVMIGLILISLFLSCAVGHKFGSVNTCKKSGGILLETGQCINLSGLDYCQFNNQIYKTSPGMITLDYKINSSEEKDID